MDGDPGTALPLAGNRAGRNNITMNIVANQVTLQAIADVGCLVTQLDGTTCKMPSQPVQLVECCEFSMSRFPKNDKNIPFS